MSVKYSLNEDPKVMILLRGSYSCEIHNAFGYAACHSMNQATNTCAFQKQRCLPNRMRTHFFFKKRLRFSDFV